MGIPRRAPLIWFILVHISMSLRKIPKLFQLSKLTLLHVTAQSTAWETSVQHVSPSGLCLRTLEEIGTRSILLTSSLSAAVVVVNSRDPISR